MSLSRPSLPIRWRLLLLVLVVLLPVLALVGWLTMSEVRHVEQVARDKVDILAAGTVADLRRFLTGLGGELRALAQRPRVRSVAAASCDPFLGEWVQTQPGYAALTIRDAGGSVVCVHPPTPQAQAVAAAAARAGDPPRAGAVTTGSAFTLPGTGRWFATVGEPIHDGAGLAVGEISAAVDLHWLNDRLMDGLPENAVVSVIDASRAVLLRSAQPAAFIGTRRATDEADPAAGLVEGFVVARGRDGVVRLIAPRPVPSTNWQVVAGLPEQNAIGDRRAALQHSVVLAAVVLLFAAALAWYIGAKIERPMRALARTAARVAGGATAARASPGGPPEVRAVATQFNDMLDALAFTEARLRGLFESAVDAIVVADGEQLIVQANQAAATMFRTTVEEMIGAPLDRFIPLRHRARHHLDVEAFGQGSATARHMGASREVQALRADGTEFPIEASISHLTINGRRLYTAIHRDATERRRIQVELAEGKAKLEAALASMNDAVFIAGADGRFHEINEAFARFLRCKDKASCPHSVEEGQRIVEVCFADGSHAPPHMWAVSRALRGETGSGVEYRLRRRDTGEHWIGSYSFAPIRAADGTIAGAVVVARDVTLAKEAQADLAASHASLQRLISAQDRIQEEERTRIARELHDDLQQILAAIRIDLGELAERLSAAASGELPLVREVDALATRAIVSTRRIVDDLRPQMIEDLGLVPALHSLAVQFARRTGIACELHAADDLGTDPPFDAAVATCVYRVAQEALNNVAKHARATRVEIRLLVSAAGQLAMSVTDDGRGIRSTDRRKPASFGLQGMTERVRAQGGRLRVERLARGGTVVEVHLPLSGPPAPPPHEETVDTPFHDSAPVALETAQAWDPPGQPTHPALQSVIDAMSCCAAVVDGDGTVQLVNRAWSESAAPAGGRGARALGPGANFLGLCRRGARDDEHAAAALRGLLDVLEGRATSFSCDCPCHSDTELRWIRMHVVPMAGNLLVTQVVVRSEPRPDGRPELESTQHIPPPP